MIIQSVTATIICAGCDTPFGVNVRTGWDGPNFPDHIHDACLTRTGPDAHNGEGYSAGCADVLRQAGRDLTDDDIRGLLDAAFYGENA